MNEKHPQNTLERCPEAVQRNLKAYTDGELTGFGKMRVARHAARCESCREEVAWLKQFAQELREQKSAVPRPELRTRILASLPDSPPAPVGSEPSFRTPLLAPRYALGTALLLAAAFGGAFALNRMAATRSAAPPESGNLAPHRKPVAETKEASSIALPNDSEHINQKAGDLFNKKMQTLAAKPPVVKIPPPTLDATEATADTPDIQFAPLERAKTDSCLQEVAQTVQSMGGATEQVSTKSGAVLTIRIPAKQVEELFHSIRHLGNFAKSQKPHGGKTPPKFSASDFSSRRQMRVPFPAVAEEDRNLTLTPDSKGFVALHIEVKPKALEEAK